ncbi:Uncharacterized protein LSUE1_G003438 [Lachnellula suecica]|uniref:DUF1941 family protein n=1 Tax=Lachnellula suecica TaxID=602035 RepID=A0A8T9CII6_9HELO|nr:Uncharacterized protein LSUE1_G003438 [Lachnellula suecica]
MAEQNRDPGVAPDGAPTFADPSSTFEKMQSLLKAKDDTSRFVGLALLKSVLDNGQLVQDPARINVLWEALSPKFLDRLLRAQENEKLRTAEAKDMVDLAVSVLHTFTVLLPGNSLAEKRSVGRISPLVKALVQSPPEITKLILQTILTLVSHPEGASEMLHHDDFSPLTEIATQYPLVLDIFGYTWMNASTSSAEVATVRENIDKIIPVLLIEFRQTDAVTLIECIGTFIPKVVPEAMSPNPDWLVPIFSTLRKLVPRKPTAAGRAACSKLAAALLQIYPVQSPVLLFKDEISANSDSKPFSYLFINLLLIDLRSSFPSLLAQLNSDGYTSTSQRLASAFDILSSFIGFLVRSLDEEAGFQPFSMPPDLLLKLRKDIAETMSLTIEYLRDRWDASIAGASGLHPSARNGTAATSEGTRLTLTWESMKDDVTADPLILAGIRALAIWIREDENENLRSESAGLMDMFMELYRTSSQGTLDFRYPVLLALEVILASEDGTDGFLGQDGWQIIFEDLRSILKNISENNSLNKSASLAQAARGLEIVRVLIAVVDHQSTSLPHEDWMEVIKVTASVNPPSSTPPSLVLELQIGALQLSAALLSKAAGGVQKRFVTSISSLSGLANQLMPLVKSLDNETDIVEFSGLLEDVSLEMEDLRI